MRALVVSLLIGCTAGACSPPPPKVEVAPAATGPRVAEPRSAEWLYATEGVAGGRKGECRAVAEAVMNEAPCKGALCRHGAALSRDWLSLCKALVPERAVEVDAESMELSKKAGGPPAPCEQEASRLLSSGCDKGEECGAKVQAWATRCSEWSTPLVVRMLEVMVERGGGERTRIDSRGCPDLLREVVKATSCAQQFACQDVLPAVDQYRQRCISAQKPATLTAAVVELSVRAGTATPVEPLSITGAAKLDPSIVPLGLEDGAGAVVMLCGKRVQTVDAYLELRKGCSDQELVIARRFEGPSGPLVRLGRLPYTNDAGFLLRYPSLRVEGEPRARYAAAAPAFVAALDQAAKLSAEPKHNAAAVKVFINALVEHQDAVRNSAEFETRLKEHDTALVPLLRELGDAKRRLLNPTLDLDKLGPALERAKRYPLADVDVEGRARLGALSPAAAFELDELLPKATAAYAEVLSGRMKMLTKSKMTERMLSKLSSAADAAASRCGQAMKGMETAERALIACAFGLETCDEATLAATTKELDRQRAAAEAAWPTAVVMLAGLPREMRIGAAKASEMAGCKEPWW